MFYFSLMVNHRKQLTQAEGKLHKLLLLLWAVIMLILFCGAKVQHVLQDDGICYSFACPLFCHDASVLHSSSMITMLSVIYVNNDVAHPVKTVTDKAYGCTRHFHPLHTSLEL
jgi:hypothetical protein